MPKVINYFSISKKIFSPWLPGVLLTIVLAACAAPSLEERTVAPAPDFARAPAASGALAEVADAIQHAHGTHYSGFKILDKSYDALIWRLALIDSAVSSLDIQTYLWYPDTTGRLILERVVRAANRGVHVRLIVDDLLTFGEEQLMYELEMHPNIELRLFNPWTQRDIVSRVGEAVIEMERLNIRMHDKLMIADSQAAIVGGRNIGDHYYGLSDAYNFHDLDLLGFGPIAKQANEMFDQFWNSEWVTSAGNLDVEHDETRSKRLWQEIREKNRSSEKLKAIGVEPKDWKNELAIVSKQLHIGRSEIIFDTPSDDKIAQNLAAEIYQIMDMAQKELLITNAYIIPNQPAIDFIRELVDRGVRVRILTNSLASHDVPAVNSYYEGWRDDILMAGAQLYEMRPDAAIKKFVDAPNIDSEYIGLHTKALVIDRKKVFIGSMNFDPRSFKINTEAGALVESPGLAEELAQVMVRDMSPENAWQVRLDAENQVYWVSGDEVLRRQPTRDASQFFMNIIFKMFPEDQY